MTVAGMSSAPIGANRKLPLRSRSCPSADFSTITRREVTSAAEGKWMPYRNHDVVPDKRKIAPAMAAAT
jgi:hypothetical protein